MNASALAISRIVSFESATWTKLTSGNSAPQLAHELGLKVGHSNHDFHAVIPAQARCGVRVIEPATRRRAVCAPQAVACLTPRS